MSVSACKGVLVRACRTVHTCRAGVSNMLGGPIERRQNVYRLRRYRLSPLSCTYLIWLKLKSSQSPGGWYGRTGAPPILSTSKPLTARAWSRRKKLGKRRRGKRDSRRLSGSFSRASGVVFDCCRYVALVTMRRRRCLMSQAAACPPRFCEPWSNDGFMNSTASQSSNSGWLGGSPWMPKSSVVFTRPVPKNICHRRLTVTLAVSGFSFETSHCARPRRLFGAPLGKGGSACGTPGCTFSPYLL